MSFCFDARDWATFIVSVDTELGNRELAIKLAKQPSYTLSKWLEDFAKGSAIFSGGSISCVWDILDLMHLNLVEKQGMRRQPIDGDPIKPYINQIKYLMKLTKQLKPFAEALDIPFDFKGGIDNLILVLNNSRIPERKQELVLEGFLSDPDLRVVLHAELLKDRTDFKAKQVYAKAKKVSEEYASEYPGNL